MTPREPHSRSRLLSIFARMRLRVPIRFKLATVSAVLTFAILFLFAAVVGTYVEDQLRRSSDSELRAASADLQSQLQASGLQARQDDLSNNVQFYVDPRIVRLAAPGDAEMRIVDRDGHVIYQRPGAPNLGAPFDGARDIGDYRVVTSPLFRLPLRSFNSFGSTLQPLDGFVAAVQYAKPRENIDRPIQRMWLLLGLGVLVGTGLAFGAGAAVARRAMRPISELTKAAREVARTRDPARTSLPRPAADDEVAELATTLGAMLAELDAARRESEAALERQREFVADASHELRTPLTSILANLELLEDHLSAEEGPTDETAVKITDSALSSSRRMRRLVGDLLLLARADAGRRVHPQRVDLVRVVQEVADESLALAAGHPLSVAAPDQPTVVDGVADDLHRLVLNLVENAFLHTPPGTPVHVSVAPADGSVIVEVSDRGPGIPAGFRENLFERFARHSGDHSSNGGSGLGLAIVRAVAEAHGGTVEAGDADGGGARFTVSLPQAPLRTESGRVEDRDKAPASEREGVPKS